MIIKTTRKIILKKVFGILSEKESIGILGDLKEIKKKQSDSIMSRVHRLYGKS